MRALRFSLMGLLLTLAGVCLWVQTPAEGYPEPSIIQRSYEFDFSYDAPRPIAVRGVNGNLNWYWYMTYKVVNNTGQDQLFVPEITIATDEGDVIIAGRNVPANVFEAVKARVDNSLLESPTQVIGRFLQGEDNAKESAAIWPATEHHVSRMRVFVEGLSGETATITNPRTGEEILMSKTLMLTFGLPGRPANPQRQTVLSEGKTWVMR